jgi:hypothetical protein
MREIFKSGSVGGAPGNRCFYLESDIFPLTLQCAKENCRGSSCCIRDEGRPLGIDVRA